MNPRQYIMYIRTVGIILVILVAVVFAMNMDRCADENEIYALVGVIVILAIVYLYGKTIKVKCNKCDGRMKISKGYPRFEFTCSKCGNVVDTNIHSDY